MLSDRGKGKREKRRKIEKREGGNISYKVLERILYLKDPTGEYLILIIK